jgi:multicomponent K+:H+ antiporter subunit F
VVALLVVLGIDFNTTAYFEAALLIALIGFISTVALCKYILRGDLIE